MITPHVVYESGEGQQAYKGKDDRPKIPEDDILRPNVCNALWGNIIGPAVVVIILLLQWNRPPFGARPLTSLQQSCM
jgi:hypothetical protein